MADFDRRFVLGSAASAGAILIGAGLARGQTPPPTFPPITPPPPSPSPPATPPHLVVPKPPVVPRPAWINFQYAVAWERMNVLQEIVAGLVDKGVSEITLMISSSGGDVAAAISCFDFLTSAGIKLTTYAIGNCYSAALLLFLAGERRVCDKPAQFIVHPAAAVTTAGSSTLDALNLRVEALDRDTKRMREIVLARSTMTEAQLDPMLLQRAAFITPQQALDYGLATEMAHLDRPPAALLLSLPLPRATP